MPERQQRLSAPHGTADGTPGVVLDGDRVEAPPTDSAWDAMAALRQQ